MNNSNEAQGIDEVEAAQVEPRRRRPTIEEVEGRLWTRRGALGVLGATLFVGLVGQISDSDPGMMSVESSSSTGETEIIRQKTGQLAQHLSAATNDLESTYLREGLEKDKYSRDSLARMLRFKVESYLGLDDAISLDIQKLDPDNGKVVINFIEKNKRTNVASIKIANNEVEIWADRSDYMENLDASKQNADRQQVLVFRFNKTSREYELVRRKHQFLDNVVIDVNLEEGTGLMYKKIGGRCNSDISGNNIAAFTFDETGNVETIQGDEVLNSRSFQVNNRDMRVLTSLHS